MADIKYSELAAQLNAQSVVVFNGTEVAPAGVYINVGRLTGDVTTALTNEGVTELAIKLLEGCNKAQTVYNTANPNATINAFPEANYGIPTKRADGSVASSVTASVVGLAPVNGNSITANA